MKYTIQEIEIMIDTVDADGDKKLSFKEFVTLMTK
jgi:Ca2+-binding EF-hand superfamily protein